MNSQRGFCESCGTALETGVSFCEECGHPVAELPGRSSCESCAGTLQPGAKFCEECGHAVAVAKPARSAIGTRPRRVAIVSGIGVIGLVGLVVGLIASGVLQGSGEPSAQGSLPDTSFTPEPGGEATIAPLITPLPGIVSDATPEPELTVTPTPEATPGGVAQPTTEPTGQPTPQPTLGAVGQPTTEPTTSPASQPTPAPSPRATSQPTPQPTPGPTLTPISDCENPPFPCPPNRFFGSALLNGVAPDAGTGISAFVGGTLCGSTEVNQSGEYTYVIDVLHHTERAGCGVSGATVSFQIAGVPVQQTAIFETGQFTELDLVAP